jgi:uncharacterized protein YejL (UPF0352 family)
VSPAKNENCAKTVNNLRKNVLKMNIAQRQRITFAKIFRKRKIAKKQKA